MADELHPDTDRPEPPPPEGPIPEAGPDSTSTAAPDPAPAAESTPESVFSRLRAQQTSISPDDELETYGAPADADPARREFTPLAGGLVRELTQDEFHRMRTHRHLRDDARGQFRDLITRFDDLIEEGFVFDGQQKTYPGFSLQAWRDANNVPVTTLTVHEDIDFRFAGYGTYHIPANRTFIEFPTSEGLALYIRDPAGFETFKTERGLTPDPNRPPRLFLDDTHPEAPKLPRIQEDAVNENTESHENDHKNPAGGADPGMTADPVTEAEISSAARPGDITKEEIGEFTPEQTRKFIDAVNHALEQAKDSPWEVREMAENGRKLPVLFCSDGKSSLPLPGFEDRAIMSETAVILDVDENNQPRLRTIGVDDAKKLKKGDAPQVAFVPEAVEQKSADNAHAGAQQAQNVAAGPAPGDSQGVDGGQAASGKTAQQDTDRRIADETDRKNRGNQLAINVDLGLASLATVLGKGAVAGGKAALSAGKRLFAGSPAAVKAGVTPDPNADPGNPSEMLRYHLVGMRSAANHTAEVVRRYHGELQAAGIPYESPEKMTDAHRRRITNDQTLKHYRDQIDNGIKMVELHSEGIEHSPLKTVPKEMESLARDALHASSNLHKTLKKHDKLPLKVDGEPSMEKTRMEKLADQMKKITEAVGKAVVKLLGMLGIKIGAGKSNTASASASPSP